METHTAASCSVVGTPTEEAWAQAFSLGNFYGVFSIFGKDSVSLSVVGKDILETLQRSYSSLSEISLLSLSTLLPVIADKYSHLQINYVFAFQTGKTLYLLGSGGGSALLLRGDKKAIILNETDHSASGFIENGDTLLLFTKRFLDIISLTDVLQIITHKSFDIIADTLAPIIHKENDSGLVSCEIIHFEHSSYLDMDTEQITHQISNKQNITEEDNNAVKLSLLSTFLSRVKPSLLTIIHKLPRFSAPFVPRLLDTKNSFYLFLHPEKNQKKRALFTVGLVLILLLTIVVVLVKQKRTTEESLSQFSITYSQAEQKYTDGKVLLTLNPTRARALLLESKKTADQVALLTRDKTKEKVKIDLLLKNISDALESVSGVYKLSTVSPYFDLNLVKKSGMGNKLSLNKGMIVILDSENKSIYSVKSQSKDIGIIGGGPEKFTNSKFISLHGNFAYTFTDSGVVETDILNKTSTTVLKKDPEWGVIGALVEFGAFKGNLYLLDTSRSRILKYISNDTGFISTKDYLNEDVKPTFSKATSMAIDGSVWILLSDGTILRFTQGRPDYFALSGLDYAFSSSSTLYTDGDSLNLYVLDRGNKRMVVVDKDKKMGEYVSQYVWDGFGQATDFTVDEANKKIYVVSGSKFYLLDLK